MKMNLQEVKEQEEIQIDEIYRCKICSEIKCQKCRKEVRQEKIGYSVFFAGMATGAILSSVFLAYLSPGVFVSCGLALGVVSKSVYDIF